MSETIKAIVLGIIQGLTEFLPVSSSGHLELAKFFMEDTNVADQSMLMTVMLHGATALSTIVIFRKDIAEMANDFSSYDWNKSSEMPISVKIMLSVLPAVFVGLLFEHQIEQLFNSQLLLVGLMLFVTGGLLFLADRAKNTTKDVSSKDAFLIGISQAIAILPGISRSGATISTSVLLGIDRERAARFSFLMVLPLIIGKMAKDLLMGELVFTSEIIVPLTAGFIAAFITGLVACTWMIQLVKNSKLRYFALYCFFIGAGAIGYSLLH
ncbi:MAG: undecaprenyl-diphosphate phosphatase [Saprospiraceae bacterium]